MDMPGPAAAPAPGEEVSNLARPAIRRHHPDRM